MLSTPVQPRTRERPASRKSELVIEGYQEPRTLAPAASAGVGEDGKPYIAVVALSVASKQAQAERKLEQLKEEVAKAEDAYNATCDQFGDESAQAQAASEAFEKLGDREEGRRCTSVKSETPPAFAVWKRP